MTSQNNRHTCNFSRRKFLAAIPAVAAGGLLAACAPSTPAAAPATAAPKPTTAPAAATSAPVAPAGEMRKLKGKVSFAYKGGVPVRGAPLTLEQTAFQKAMDQYKQFQPNVEIELIDVPAGISDEQWSQPIMAAKQMADLVHVDNAYILANTDQYKAGTMQLISWWDFANEPNPYNNGKPWKECWVSDAQRLARTYQGMPDLPVWVSVTNEETIGGVLVNLDILKEFGLSEFPKTWTDLHALSKKINDGGKYDAWEAATGTMNWLNNSFVSDLTWELWKKGGGGDDPAGTPMGVAGTYKNRCTGLWGLALPEYKETILQTKKWIESFKGGVAGYFAQDDTKIGQRWLNGGSVFLQQTNNFMGQIRVAEAAGTLKAKNWGVFNYPDLTKDDLVNKDLKIYFDGHFWNIEQPILEFRAIDPRWRKSGADPNIDLIVRDMLQFWTSAYGSAVVAAKGGIPQNPVAVADMDPRLAMFTKLRHPSLKGIIKGPGDRILAWPGPGFDKVRNLLQGFLLGQMSYEEWAKQAEDAQMSARVTQYTDQFKAGTQSIPLDDACAKWGWKK